MRVTQRPGEDAVCEHGTALDVHCCNCHSGFLFDINACVCEVLMMDKKTRGLYDKFQVARTDGQSAPGAKHDGCEYFVLDLDHDPHARAALQAYADACRQEYPRLAADLDRKLVEKAFGCTN